MTGSCCSQRPGSRPSSTRPATEPPPCSSSTRCRPSTATPPTASPATWASPGRRPAHLYAKTTGTPVIMVGHVTKEGQLAGPRLLEHMVDTVLSSTGMKHAARMLRATKNRFGLPGAWRLEMTGEGLRGIDNPSEAFLSQRETPPSAPVSRRRSGIARSWWRCRRCWADPRRLSARPGGADPSRRHAPRGARSPRRPVRDRSRRLRQRRGWTSAHRTGSGPRRDAGGGRLPSPRPRRRGDAGARRGRPHR